MKLTAKIFTWLLFSFFLSIQCFAQLRTIRTEIGEKADQRLHYALVAPVMQTMDYLSTARSEEDRARYLSYLKSTAQKIALDIDNNEPTLKVLIKIRRNSEIDQSLVVKTSRIIGAGYDYLIGEVKLKDLKDVAEMDDVVFIEPSYLMSIELDHSVNDVNATSIWDCGGNGINECITGRNVIIGIIDQMPNRDHITFHDEAGNSRFQQYVNSNPHYHGSHVAGIAAGRGDQDAFNRGIAYDSDLLWYPIGISNDLLSNVQDLINTANGTALVINYSAGSTFGPRDGTTILDQALGALIQNNVVFVKSAGNNSSSTSWFNHFEGDVPNQNGEFIEFEFQLVHDAITAIEIWHNSQFDVQVSDANSANLTWSDTISYGTTVIFDDYPGNTNDFIQITNSENNFYIGHTGNQGNTSGSRIIYLEYGSSDDFFAPGTYHIRLYPNNSIGGQFDAYHNNSKHYGGFINGNNYQTITNPGYCSQVITVAASQKNLFGGDWAPYSSLGPSRIDEASAVSKPDITAPGGSDEEQNAFLWSASSISNTAWTGMTGTSMAAPHVTGAIALLMENFPQLNAAQVKEILQNSAAAIPNGKWQGDNKLTPEDRKYWGAGKLDILAAYQSMVGFDYTPLPGNITKKFKGAYFPDLAGLPVESVVSAWNAPDFYIQKLSNGAIFHDEEDEEAFWMGEGIWQKWLEINDVNSTVGLPATSEYPDANNNDYPTVFFKKGKIYWDGENTVVCNFNVEFAADQQTGDVPFTVTFTDQSTATNSAVTGWLWDFGDGIFSSEQNPTHTYYSSGSFDVTLTIYDHLQGFSMTKNNYISTEMSIVESVIEQIEYFINEDPGFGNATQLTIAPSPVIESLIFSIDISSLNNGFNHLYVRARDDENVWSITNVKSFYVEPAYALPHNIVKAEFFINTDPGLGNGITIPVSASPDITNIGFVAGIDTLPMGFHHLYVRTQDANDVWSLTNVKSFYVEPAFAASQQIVQAEYFVNTDPGLGSGINIPITPSHEITNLVFTVDISDLPMGFHHLYLRTKDENDVWSLTNVKSFYKEVIYTTPQNIVKTEYFFNTDPGMGNGTELALTPAPDLSGLVFIADVLPLPLMENVLYVRAMDQNGKWSLTNIQPFVVECADVIVDFESGGCATIPTEFVDYSINMHPLSEYRWNFGDGAPELITGVGNVLHTYSEDGEYNVRLIIKSREGCQDTLVRQVIINEPPTVYAGVDQTICVGNAITLNATYTYGTLSWSHGVVNGQPFYPTQTTTYTATSNSIYGCGPVTDQVTVTVIQPPVANAGPDVTICEDATYAIAGASAIHYSSLHWSGNVNNPNILNPVYTPTPADIAQGFAELWLTLQPINPCNVSDTDAAIITIQRNPVVFAGADATICEDESFSLNLATAANYSTLLWSGNVNNPQLLNPVYTPTAADIANGYAMLCITAQPLNPCTVAAADCQIITIVQNPTAYAGNDATICDNEQFVQSAATAMYYSSLEWQTNNGMGSFVNANQLAATYVPHENDPPVVELCLQAAPINPCVTSSYSCMQLTIIPSPEIQLSAPANGSTICAGTELAISFSALNYSGISFSTSGDGLFSGISQGSVFYYPGPGDLAAGFVNLCAEGLPLAGCSVSAQDCIELIVQPDPAIVLLSDLYLDCANFNFSNQEWLPVLLAAEVENAFSFQWTTNGDGLFNEPTASVTHYNIGDADIISGQVVLTLEASGYDLCNVTAVADLTLHIPGQLIPVAQGGWRGISSYVDQSGMSLPEVLAPVGNKLNIILNEAGYYYSPAQGVNQIGNWDAVGYNANFVNPPACLPIYGSLLSDQTFVISGEVTYLPVLTDLEISIEAQFAGHLDKIQSIFDWSTFTTWTPTNPSLAKLTPGYAYLLTTTSPATSFTIEYPPYSRNAPLTSVNLRGRLTNVENGNPVQGVEIQADGQPSAFTNADGYYVLSLPAGWSGVLTPIKEDWGFEPATRSLNNLIVNVYDQHFQGESFVCDPGWSYTTTIFSHSIQIPLSTNPQFFGVPLTDGDWIGAFYLDDNGEEACGGYALWSSSSPTAMSLYGNDPLTSWKDGFDNGEIIHWKLYKCSEFSECSAIATYNTGFPNHNGTFAMFGFSSLTSLICQFCQELTLQQHWNSVSLYVNPSNPAVSNLLLPIENDLVIMRNLNSMYWPEQSINTIGNWNLGSGYVMKMTNAGQLNVCGSPILNQQASFSVLDGNWHYLPILSTCSVDADLLFGPNSNNITIVKELIGFNVWWPEQGITSLSTLHLGRAYEIRIKTDVSISFPNCEKMAGASAEVFQNEKNTAWGEVISTPYTHIISVPEVVAKDFSTGDQIGVFDMEGNCFGAIEIDGINNSALVVFGNDPFTNRKTGFDENEPLTFKLWQKETGKEIQLKVSFDQDMPDPGLVFKSSGLSRVENIQTILTSVNEISSSDVLIYPNPSENIFTIRIQSHEQPFEWKVTNTHGSLVLVSQTPNDQTIDLTHYPKGIYYLSIDQGGLLFVRKLVLR